MIWVIFMQTILDVVKFQSENFPLADQIYAILAESDVQSSKKLKKKRSEEGSSSVVLMERI